jgi:hypothetical protein
MTFDIRLASIARISGTIAMLLALYSITACGGYDVGPPQPWGPPADSSSQSARK